MAMFAAPRTWCALGPTLPVMTASAPCEATVLPAWTPAPPLASTLAALSCARHLPVSVSATMNQRARPNLGSTRESISLLCALTVSYTHLRAHETRHDLVCRLLL